ncbi:MAG: ATP-binding protein [Acetobacteraceae bacterium]
MLRLVQTIDTRPVLPRSRWYVLLGFGIWLLASVAGWVLGTAYLTQFRIQQERNALARAQVAAEAIEQSLLRTLEAVEAVHELSETRERLLAGGDDGGAAAIADHLTALVRREAYGILQVATIDRTGHMTWSTTGVSDRLWLGDREHFRVHRNGREDLFVSTPLVGRASSRWSVQLTRPIHDPAGIFAGVSVVSFDPLKLSETLSTLRFGEGSVSTVMRLPNGHVIGSSQAINRALAKSPDPDHPILVAARSAPSGTLRLRPPAAERPLLLAYRVVGSLPLIVAVGLDAEHELAGVGDVGHFVRTAEVAFSALAFTLVLVVWQVAGRMRARSELELTRRNVETAERARAHLTRLLSGLPAAVYSAAVARNGAVTAFEVTENAERLTGWPIAELRHRYDWTNKIDPEGKLDWGEHFRKLAREGDGAVEYPFRRPDGSVIWLRDQARVVERQPHETSLIGYVSDITRERTLHAQSIATSKLATLGEMAAGLAHELNQPIAIMSLAAENAALALRRPDGPRLDFALGRMERIVEQSTRARTIIDHLRIFGRSREEPLGPFDLANAVTGALTLMGSAMRNAGITVETSLPRDLPPVMGQEVLAEQVIVNLMLNARDALNRQPDGCPREIIIWATPASDRDRIELMVADSGPGIPDDAMNRIFEPFFTTKEVGKGTGLGLSICHGIMDSFGGAIAAHNAERGGAVFMLSFVAAPPQAGSADPPATIQEADEAMARETG